MFREHSALFWRVLCSVSLADGKTSASHPQVGAVPFLFVPPFPHFPFRGVSPDVFHSSPLGEEPHSCTYWAQGFSQETGRFSSSFQDCSDLGIQLKIYFYSLFSLPILFFSRHRFIWELLPPCSKLKAVFVMPRDSLEKPISTSFTVLKRQKLLPDCICALNQRGFNRPVICPPWIRKVAYLQGKQFGKPFIVPKISSWSTYSNEQAFWQS